MTGRSRRALLRRAGTALAVGGAGCLGDPGSTPSPTLPAVIRDTGFDGKLLVVELAPGHEVSRLNLIGPDGSAVAHTKTETGETKGQLEIIDIERGLSGFEHYSVGKHELIAVKEKPESVDLWLQPELRISGVDYVTPDGESSVTGRVSVTVENVGKAPTWIYDITYTGAPNEEANDSLSNNPGIPLIERPCDVDGLILEPGESNAFVGSSAPLVFDAEASPSCDGSVEMAVIVGSAANHSYRQDVRASLNGEIVESAFTDNYLCSAIEIGELNGEF